jgi:DNA-binding GntR family transcriptional regulator
MIHPISRYFLQQLKRHDRQVKPLEAAIRNGLSTGVLKPGDPISTPDRLAKKLNLSPIDVLESVNQLLALGILRQNHDGDLFIAANPTSSDGHSTTQQVA